jgi:Cu-Zn family superoxide dismutase
MSIAFHMRRKIMKAIAALLVPLAALALAVGCESSSNAQDASSAKDGGHKEAVAKIMPSKASATQPANGQPKGEIKFHEMDGKVHITGEISGLKPNSKHAIHIHEKPDLSAPDLMSTGGHYNPDKHVHGGPTTSPVHAGDLGNLEANDKGVAKMDLTVDDISLGGEKNNVVGLPVIIHAKEDDYKSQPSGNAGGRIAGGLIEMSK